jgi:hypothetical protein
MTVKLFTAVGLGAGAILHYHVADWRQVAPSAPDQPTQGAVTITLQTSTGSALGWDVQRFETVRDEVITWLKPDHRPIAALSTANGNASVPGPAFRLGDILGRSST